MNATNHIFEVSVEARQLDETILSLFHTLLFHRSTGKFHYQREGTYSIDTVGIVDVDCEHIDFTYVRCNSELLMGTLQHEVGSFRDALKSCQSPQATGQICLEFYQKKKTRWLFQPECIPWEIWTIYVELISLNSDSERQVCREKVGEQLSEKILSMTEAINRLEYIPKMPTLSEIDNVFDTNYPDVQPYLFKIKYDLQCTSNGSVSNAMRMLIRDTMSL